jgi:hypothetical protein
MEDKLVLDMTDLEAARRRFDEFGQVSAQMSKNEYKLLHKAAGINEKMLRLGKRRDVIGRIFFYLSLIPAALKTELMNIGRKRLEGAYDFYLLYRNTIEHIHQEPISDTTVLVTFYKKKPAGKRTWH